MAGRNDTVGYLVMYGSSLSDAQAQQECADTETFMTEMYRTAIDKRVVITGDSQTTYWLSKLTRRIDWNVQTLGYEFIANGVFGQSLSTMNTNYAAKEALLYDSTKAKNVIFVWAATNDISSGTPVATVQTRFETFCTSAQSSGYLVIAMPTMARNFLSDSAKTLAIDTFNVWLAANYATFADAYTGFPAGEHYYKPRADFASDALYIAHNQTIIANATYYIDGTHLTENVGYKEWADLCATTLLTV